MTAEHSHPEFTDRERARDRALEALLEQEFTDEPPIAAILRRAHPPAAAMPRRRTSSWLAAALALLGIGVAIALAWQQRRAEDDRNAATTPEGPVPSPLQDPAQDPTNSGILPTGDVRWPVRAPRIDDVFGLPTLPDTTRHLHLGLPLHFARDLSRLESLQHLDVELAPRMVAGLVRAGTEPRIAGRLDTLATTPNLRSLALAGLAVTPADLAALQHLKKLESLSVGSFWRPDDKTAAFRPLDRELGAAIAKWNPAPALSINTMPVTAAGLTALARSRLRALTIDGVSDTQASDLLPLGEFASLRHLTLRWIHSDTAAEPAQRPLANFGSAALSVDVMRRIAKLPNLDTLVLDGCFLDRDLVAALPRGLERLDLSRCFGVDDRLAAVISEMPRMRDLGLPLQAENGKALASMWLPPLPDEIAQQRLSPAAAFEILGDRSWPVLRLHGRLTEKLAAAVSSQAGLRDLTITPTAHSESLAFVEHLPRLVQVTLLQSEVSGALLEPLNRSASLRSVILHDCVVAMPPSHPGEQDEVLRDGITVRWSCRSSMRH
ncbi:MAG: hypothetical protein NXI31_12365 [bacterium]|nr:hypothetical protein [bacterium]